MSQYYERMASEYTSELQDLDLYLGVIPSDGTSSTFYDLHRGLAHIERDAQRWLKSIAASRTAGRIGEREAMVLLGQYGYLLISLEFSHTRGFYPESVIG